MNVHESQPPNSTDLHTWQSLVALLGRLFTPNKTNPIHCTKNSNMTSLHLQGYDTHKHREEVPGVYASYLEL